MSRHPDYMNVTIGKIIPSAGRPAVPKSSVPAKPRPPSKNVPPKKVTTAPRKATQGQGKIQQTLLVNVHVNQKAAGSQTMQNRNPTPNHYWRKPRVNKQNQNPKQPVQVVINIQQSAGNKKKWLFVHEVTHHMILNKEERKDKWLKYKMLISIGVSRSGPGRSFFGIQTTL